MSKPDKYYQNAAQSWLSYAQDDLSWTENNIDKEQAEDALALAREIFEFVKKKLTF